MLVFPMPSDTIANVLIHSWVFGDIHGVAHLEIFLYPAFHGFNTALLILIFLVVQY